MRRTTDAARGRVFFDTDHALRPTALVRDVVGDARGAAMSAGGEKNFNSPMQYRRSNS